MTKLRIMFAALLVALAISACSQETTPEPTTTSTPEPPPTATSAATDTPEPIKGNFIPYQSNPVITQEARGSWDAGMIFNGHAVFYNGLYHMFYNGSPSPSAESVAIGYATSLDGRSFTKHALNPILAGDESGFDAFQAGYGAPLVERNTWILYYNAGSGSGPGPGPAIGRATASDPTGPWARNRRPVLTVGGPGEWDRAFVVPDSVIATDEGYVMYYSAGPGQTGRATIIGMATSPDGITWTKYNDPSTTEPPFAESDSVLQPGPPGSWDSAMVWACDVLKTANGWEMFYTGSDMETVQIGYATSNDGVHWIKHEDNPILTPAIDPLASETAPLALQAPSVIVDGSTYTLYYDYGLVTGGIGMAAGTIP